MERKSYRTHKFGSWKRSHDLDIQVTKIGSSEGILFQFDKIKRTPNTLITHKLIKMAQKEGMEKAVRVIESLFYSYFTRGLDISDKNVLIDISLSVGIDQEKVSRALEDHSPETLEVKTDENR